MNSMNLHPLLTATIPDCYEEQISLSRDDRSELMGARSTIRAYIRTELPKRLVAARVDESIERIVPKFITQGSVAYGLINAPAHPPRQQADLDDGVYVPLSFCEDTGSPRAVSRLLVDSVESLLIDLARTLGWTVDTKNPNCTRVVIAADKHVDIPVYSIPDIELRKIAQNRYMLAHSRRPFSDYYVSSDLDDVWELMPPRVRLAHKLLGWVDSDPRPIKEWIERQVGLKSEQLRRTIRYLKAWRDVQSWPGGGPKSLLLMALVDAVLDQKVEGRDDIGLVQVCGAMPARLRHQVTIRAIPNEDLSKQLDKDGIRNMLVDRVRSLHGALSACVSGRYSPQDACRVLRQHFGPRFPNRPDRIRIDTAEAVVHAVAPRRIVAAPIVGRREAG